ncbi:hypothetical protein FD30_GL001073 [Levilactobacillus namurensis DSM 19117]|uniref:Uncharacterized protein n=1 Tax=Levilactobacillus namurensis DSM 19117 TaxID=1423773 RepID=A0A0R1K030_9LACO|nr:hypothetical protein FD30_GL001073 [Levilactobacillus namurensis DSM 19117]GEO75124.1 hypothetical protein LNA02_18220 [Levilactobacillus namurensis]
MVIVSALPGGQTGLERRGHNLEPQVQVSKLGLFLGEPKTLTKENFTAEPCLTALTAYTNADSFL